MWFGKLLVGGGGRGLEEEDEEGKLEILNRPTAAIKRVQIRLLGGDSPSAKK